MAIPDRPTVEQTWTGHAPTSYETPFARLGRKGLNLVDALSELDPSELARMVNVVSRFGSAPAIRLGQTALGTTTGTDHVHSLTRLNDPGASSFTRLAGSNTTLYRGTTGAFTLIDSGYSGDPLTFAQSTAPLTGVPYTIIGDRSRNRKVARTGAVATIGVSAPTVPAVVTVAAENTTNICRFDNVGGDGTQAANWALTVGTDTAGTAVGNPSAIDAGDGVEFTINPGGAGAGLGYYSTVGITKILNLGVLQGGLYVATDDDLMNLRFAVDRPDRLEELRIYLVCSNVFDPGVEPGTSDVSNTDAYFKAFRPNDLTAYIDVRAVPASQTVAAVGDTVRDRELREEFKDERFVESPRAEPTIASEQGDLSRTAIPAIQLGRSAQTVTGIVGYPLRRGEFSRMGNAAGRDWSTIVGIVIVIRANTNQSLTVGCDDWRMTGGGGPDTTDPTAQAYDVRYTNYDPGTGEESNPSPVMSVTTWCEALRQPLNMVPWVAGISSMRQRFYRRGGLPQTSDDWYYDGVNASDGGVYQTYLADAVVLTQGTLEIDNDEPVTSVNSAGATVLAKVMPIYFAVGDYLFALGDTNQPQRLYRSKKGRHGAWPAPSYDDVCGASDELMNGGEWAGGGFVFSRSRLYAILINDGDGSWTTEPTGCTEGLVGRWAFCWTPYGLAFVSPFGVRLTTGGSPQTLSDEQIGPLFRGDTVHGFNPIDFTVPTALKLAYHDHELWFTYQDQTGAACRHLVHNFFDKAWRSYLFGEPVSVVYSEPVQGVAASLLLGGRATGQIYTHSGFSDDGAAIAYTLRTGALAFGDLRAEKLLSAILLDAELQTATLTVQAFLDDELTSVTAQTVTGTAGMRRYGFEPFGTTPQRARNVSVELRGSAPTASRLVFDTLGVSRLIQPEIVFNEPTAWGELPGGEGYVWGCAITCDTANTARSVEVEYTTSNGAVTSAATLAITADGRKKLLFTWTAVLAHQIRLRPTGSCVEWLRYKVEWFSDPEPPRVNGWNTNWESYGSYADKWLKGALLEIDTFNVAKTVVIDIDQSLAVVNLGSVTQNGRGVQQFSFAKSRGKIFRLRATDSNPGKLYRWTPIFDEEPLALVRWESQETDHGRPGWQKVIEAWITLRSSADVTLTITARGEDGTDLNTSPYVITSTGGAKRKRRVTFNPTKGVLYTYVFTCASAFWLYREESEVTVEDWTSGQLFKALIYGSDDRMVPPRPMGTSPGASAAQNAQGGA